MPIVSSNRTVVSNKQVSVPIVEMSRILEVVCLLLGFELQNYGSIQKSPLVTGQYIHVAMEKLHSYSDPESTIDE